MMHVMKRLSLAVAVMALVAGAMSQAQAGHVLISGNEMEASIQGYLADRGWTSTIVDPTLFGSADLSGYDAIWLGWATNFTYDGATKTNLEAFLNAGGNILAESAFSNVLEFIPFGEELTQTFGGTNEVEIVDPGNPVVAGLTSADLSFWDDSAHDGFSLTGIGSFSGIVKDANSSDWVTVVKSVGAGYLTVTTQDPSFHIKFGSGDTGSFSTKATFVVNALGASAVPEPSSMVSLGIAGVIGLVARRRKAAPATA